MFVNKKNTSCISWGAIFQAILANPHLKTVVAVMALTKCLVTLVEYFGKDLVTIIDRKRREGLKPKF